MDEADGRDAESGVGHLRERARRRWLFTMVGAGIVGGLSGGLVPAIFDHRHRSGGGHSIVGVAVGAVVVVAVAVAGMLITRRSSKPDGMFAPPLSGGLPRRQRRAAMRAVRMAKPSTDPVQREVETDSARRLVVYGRRSLWFFVLFIGLEFAEAVFGDHNSAGTAFFYAAAVMFAGFLAYQRYMTIRARRYLAASDS